MYKDRFILLTKRKEIFNYKICFRISYNCLFIIFVFGRVRERDNIKDILLIKKSMRPELKNKNNNTYFKKETIVKISL